LSAVRAGENDTVARRADDAMLAVAAHALLNSVAVAYGSIQTVRGAGDRLTAHQTDDLLGRALVQLDLVSGILHDLVRGMPPQLLSVMDELQSSRRLPGPDS
jgi:hypothetical protein